MIIEKTMDSGWLSNSYLVADRAGGSAVLIDTGGPADPHLSRIQELDLTVTHVLCTHHHVDHVTNNSLYHSRFGCPVCGHGAERQLFGELHRELADGEEIRSGGLFIRALHIPGHTIGQLAYLVNDREVFTGDTLFRGSVGGTRAPGHGTFEQLHHSILEILLQLPPKTVVRPGHTEPSTIGEELENNPFVRMWRGLDAPGSRRCTAFGKPATLFLRARDYDGGTKCWVRFDETGEQATVPGSRVHES